MPEHNVAYWSSQEFELRSTGPDQIDAGMRLLAAGDFKILQQFTSRTKGVR
jgi:hypothetical protein